MSQDNNNLYSAFKRPRETMLPYSNTSIPQPASAMKRSTSGAIPPPRASMLPGSMGLGVRGPSVGGNSGSNALHRSSSGGDLAQLGSAIKPAPDSARFSTRKSLAPGAMMGGGGGGGAGGGGTAPGTQRRSSTYHRQSSFHNPHGASASVFSSAPLAVAGGPLKDPRPIRDRNFQARVAQDLLDYLSMNGFEMEMKHQISPNFLKSPTGKDFSTMFEWLYKRIDPNYRFQKAVTEEVIPILKTLRYPYYQSITKSGLAAVGGANTWHIYLAMLHWMYELVVTMDRIESNDYDDAVEAEGYEIAGDRIIFEFLSKSYHAWLNVEDDHQEFVDDMVAQFDHRVAKYLEESQALAAENTELEKTVAELNNRNQDGKTPLQVLEETRSVLEKDKKKFMDYIAHLEQRIQKTTQSNHRLKQECESLEEETASLEEERTALQRAVDKQGLTPADIDRMNTEREKLDKGLIAISQRLADLKLRSAESESTAQHKLEALEHAVTRYNTLAYQLGITPPSAQNAGGKEYELMLFPNRQPHHHHHSAPSSSLAEEEEDKFLHDGLNGYQPAQLLNRDLKFSIKPSLLKLRQEITERIHTHEDESIRSHELIDKVNEALSELADIAESLNAKIHAAKTEMEGIKETMAAETNASNTEIEKLERELQALRIGMNNGVLQLEQRWQGVNIEYDQLQHAAAATRQELHGEVERALNDIIKFKVHVQNGLTSMETITEEESKVAGKVPSELLEE